MDEWWKGEEQPRINVIKVDTEGSEKSVLEGGEECIKQCRPVIFFELSKTNLEAYNLTGQEIIRWLAVRSYRITNLYGAECTIEKVRNMMEEDDMFVARPR